MGPLAIEFAFLSLSFSQDVMLPYIAIDGVSQTYVSCDGRIVYFCGWLFFSVSEILHTVKYQSLYVPKVEPALSV